MVEVKFGFIGSLEGVECTLDGSVNYSDSAGFCSFFDVSQGEHSYSVAVEGMHVVSGADVFDRPLYDSGITVIEWAPVPGTPWPEDQPWLMLFTLEVDEVPPEPSEGQNILGKIGSALASVGFVGMILNSSRKH